MRPPTAPPSAVEPEPADRNDRLELDLSRLYCDGAAAELVGSALGLVIGELRGMRPQNAKHSSHSSYNKYSTYSMGPIG
jgi:hypothetical protein